MESNVNSSVYEVGAEIDQYTVAGLVQVGGMGEIYKVFNPQLDRFEALKLLKPAFASNREFVERFLAEAKRIAQLDHPHIVPIYWVSELGHPLKYFTMKLIQGKSLFELFQEKPSWTEEEMRAIILPVAKALSYAHDHGLVHRDIKPANIMVDQTGHVFLLDFGIAKALADTQLTQVGTQMGTAAYMAPEQARDASQADFRSDLYSLGVVMFEMVTGRLPFLGETPINLALQHLNDPPPDPRSLNHTLSDESAEIILLLMEKEPDHRFANARALIAALGGETAPKFDAPAVDKPEAPFDERPGPTPPPSAKPFTVKKRDYAIFGALAGVFLSGVLLLFTQLVLGRLVLYVDPPDAEVTVAGQRLRPPFHVTLLRGQQKVGIAKSGYHARQVTVDIPAGQVTAMSFSLAPTEESLKAWTSKGEAAYRSGQVAEAIAQLQGILTAQPQYLPARLSLTSIYINRAVAARKGGKPEEVLLNIDQAISVATHGSLNLTATQRLVVADLLNSVAVKLANRDKAAATRHFQRAIELDPKELLYRENLKSL